MAIHCSIEWIASHHSTEAALDSYGKDAKGNFEDAEVIGEEGIK